MLIVLVMMLLFRLRQLTPEVERNAKFNRVSRLELEYVTASAMPDCH